MFKNKMESYLGVDIGAGGIKLVEIRKTKGRPQLWTYALLDQPLDIHIKAAQEKALGDSLEEKGAKDVPLAKDDKKSKQKEVEDPRIAEYAKLLKFAIEKAHVSAKHVTASLPVSHIFHAIVNLPMVDKKELEYHVQAKIKKMLPRPIEEMQVVHQVIPALNKENEKSIKTLVTAAPKGIVRFYTDIFQKAGLNLDELETEAFALERSLVGVDNSTVMIVDIGAERTNFFIIDQGFPITHRSVQMGGDIISTILKQKLGIDENDVSMIKRDISRIQTDKLPPDLFLRLIDPIIKEIQYSFNLFLHQTGNENKNPEKIILTGGSSVFPAIAEAISEAFPMKVFVGDPWARVVYQQGLKSILNNLGPRMAASIGLALRGIV
jgi:type IV pilus assembly protein PilM